MLGVEKDSFEPPVAPKSSFGESVAEEVKDAIPSAGKMFSKSGTVLKGGEDDFIEQLRELQTWEQPFNSAIVVGGITFLYYLTSGVGAYSGFSLLCYTLIYRLVSVAAMRKGIASLEKNEKAKSVISLLERISLLIENWLMIPSPTQISSIVKGTATIVEGVCNRICKQLAEATEPTKEGLSTLKVVLGHLVGIIILLKLFSFSTIVYFFSMYQMIWPALYTRHQTKIDQIYDRAATKAKPHMEKLKEHGDVLYKKLEEKAMVLFEKLLQKVKELGGKALEKYNEKMAKNTGESTEEEKKKDQ